MLLEKIVKSNELGVIKELINDFKPENAARVFTTYMQKAAQDRDKLSIIEKQFFEALESNLHELCADLTINEFVDYKKELRSVLIDGHYSFREDDYCNLYDTIEFYDDHSAYPAIKAYMEGAYERVVAKLNETEKMRTDAQIKNLEDEIKRFQDAIDRDLEKLAKLKQS